VVEYIKGVGSNPLEYQYFLIITVKVR